MAESSAYARRGYGGAAKDTTLAAGINASATSFSAADLSTWTTTTSNGPARATISDGTNEEEFEFTGISSNTFTGVTRGVGGTTALAWDGGESITHTSSVRDFNEANYAVAKTVGAVDAANQLLVSDAANSFAKLAVGASSIVGRKASGDVVALTTTGAKALLAIANTDVSGLGTASTKDTGYTANKIPVLTATPGTPDGTKFLRDDGTWAAASGGGSATLVGARAYRSTTQAISNSTFTAIQFADESWDTDAFHDTSSNNTRMTVPTGKDGKYRITAAVYFDANATGERTIQILKNATGTYGVLFVTTAGVAGSGNVVVASGTVVLAAGDYIECFVKQTSGGSLNVIGAGEAAFSFLELVLEG